ncbi:LodA/GoxA family CTQ-dependent oxidase [Kitasatospora sp. NPDC058190]|uniref:LodA/GoxA family CTQ-dependent oxidase n=1 Tax=Kitasatospora sp. NPDC058190 TaxID=3346371 RepID=UPI0036DA3CC5
MVRRVKGASAKHENFDSGTNTGKKVGLGEVWTDERGRLLILGGNGGLHPAGWRPPGSSGAQWPRGGSGRAGGSRTHAPSTCRS